MLVFITRDRMAQEALASFLCRLATVIYQNHFMALTSLQAMRAPVGIIWDLETFILGESYSDIRMKLQTLHDVGLGYVHLGQPATTLSGGEAQRVKLSTELSRRATGRTLYVLDEPTTGLHFADVEKLLEVLHRLVDGGNTVLVIEHNLDVIKTADWIVDLGPGGGDRGGRIIAEGTPEKVARTKASATGEYLARVLRGEPLVPLSDVTFADEAGRGARGIGRDSGGTIRIAPSRKRAAAARAG